MVRDGCSRTASLGRCGKPGASRPTPGVRASRAAGTASSGRRSGAAVLAEDARGTEWGAGWGERVSRAEPQRGHGSQGGTRPRGHRWSFTRSPAAASEPLCAGCALIPAHGCRVRAETGGALQGHPPEHPSLGVFPADRLLGLTEPQSP